MSQNIKMCKTSRLQALMALSVNANCSYSHRLDFQLLFRTQACVPPQTRRGRAAEIKTVLTQLASKTQKPCKTLYENLQSKGALKDHTPALARVKLCLNYIFSQCTHKVSLSPISTERLFV